MQKKEKVLVIGRHAAMLLKVTALLRQHGYDAVGAQENDEAFALFTAEKINAVIVGGGVDFESRSLFHSKFPEINPAVKIIDAHPQTAIEALEAVFRQE